LGQLFCPKYAELIRIIKKQLLLHLVGRLPYYVLLFVYLENRAMFLQISEMHLPLNEESCNSDCLGVSLKVLLLVGLWQNFTNHAAQWTVKAFNFYKWTLLLLMITNATLEITDILLTWEDLKNLAENGSVALICVAAIFKQNNFKWREQRIKLAVNSGKTIFRLP
jgi:hypothetical protein